MGMLEYLFMEKKLISVRTVVAIGIGSAIMFVLMRFVALPSGVPNTTLNLASAILTLFAAVFGPIAGLFIGFIGHALVDLTWGSFWWSWIIADAAFGLFIGLFIKTYKIKEGDFKFRNAIIFNVIQILSNIAAWVLIAPTLDIIMYGEPANKVFIQGLTAAGLNSAVILILGTALAFGYSKTRTKTGSLHTDD
jgi:energy-coupling factor transport system substrate-specific component